MQRSRNGYSMVEVLIALLILLILSGFVASAVVATREAARTKSCVSNIRQWSNGIALYVQDYDGTYPLVSTGAFYQRGSNPDLMTAKSGTAWNESVLPYLGRSGSEILLCPAVDPHVFPNGTRLRYRIGYAFNLNLSEATYDTGQKTKQFQANPDYKIRFDSLTVVLSDARLGIIALGEPDETELGRLNVLYSRNLKPQISRLPLGATRHRDGANYAFADGHVRWFKPNQLRIERVCDGKTPGFGL